MTPTVPQIRAIVREAIKSKNPIAASIQIHNLMGSTYKPLSDLMNDEEACRKIFNWVADKDPDLIFQHDEERFEISNNGNPSQALFIWSDGEIFFEINGKDCAITHHFEFVDLIRSLGYSN